MDEINRRTIWPQITATHLRFIKQRIIEQFPTEREKNNNKFIAKTNSTLNYI